MRKSQVTQIDHERLIREAINEIAVDRGIEYEYAHSTIESGNSILGREFANLYLTALSNLKRELAK